MKQSKKTKNTLKKTKQPKYKFIFIDWNGTLSGSKFWWQLEDPNHPHSSYFKRIENSLFGNLRETIKPWMRGELTSEKVIKEVSNHSKLEYNLLLEEFIKSCESMKLGSKNILTLLKKIKNKNAKVVIATDNMDSFSRWTVPGLELNKHFDYILNSFDLKALKGDKDESGKSLFFSKFIETHKIKPSESLIIDDSEDKEGRIQSWGIEYRKIEPIVGLEPELKRIISVLN